MWEIVDVRKNVRYNCYDIKKKLFTNDITKENVLARDRKSDD